MGDQRFSAHNRFTTACRHRQDFLQSICNQLAEITGDSHILSLPSVLCKCLSLQWFSGISHFQDLPTMGETLGRRNILRDLKPPQPVGRDWADGPKFFDEHREFQFLRDSRAFAAGGRTESADRNGLPLNSLAKHQVPIPQETWPQPLTWPPRPILGMVRRPRSSSTGLDTRVSVSAFQ